MDFYKILKTLILIALNTWILSLVLAPLTLPPNTIDLGDEGRANIIDYDYYDRWSKLPLYHRVVYLVGDIGCHQKSSRSFYTNGNQMPVCSRCLGLFMDITMA